MDTAEKLLDQSTTDLPQNQAEKIIKEEEASRLNKTTSVGQQIDQETSKNEENPTLQQDPSQNQQQNLQKNENTKEQSQDDIKKEDSAKPPEQNLAGREDLISPPEQKKLELQDSINDFNTEQKEIYELKRKIIQKLKKKQIKNKKEIDKNFFSTILEKFHFTTKNRLEYINNILDDDGNIKDSHSITFLENLLETNSSTDETIYNFLHTEFITQNQLSKYWGGLNLFLDGRTTIDLPKQEELILNLVATSKTTNQTLIINPMLTIFGLEQNQTDNFKQIIQNPLYNEYYKENLPEADLQIFLKIQNNSNFDTEVYNSVVFKKQYLDSLFGDKIFPLAAFLELNSIEDFKQNYKEIIPDDKKDEFDKFIIDQKTNFEKHLKCLKEFEKYKETSLKLSSINAKVAICEPTIAKYEDFEMFNSEFQDSDDDSRIINKLTSDNNLLNFYNGSNRKFIDTENSLYLLLSEIFFGEDDEKALEIAKKLNEIITTNKLITSNGLIDIDLFFEDNDIKNLIREYELQDNLKDIIEQYNESVKASIVNIPYSVWNSVNDVEKELMFDKINQNQIDNISNIMQNVMNQLNGINHYEENSLIPFPLDFLATNKLTPENILPNLKQICSKSNNPEDIKLFYEFYTRVNSQIFFNKGSSSGNLYISIGEYKEKTMVKHKKSEKEKEEKNKKYKIEGQDFASRYQVKAPSSATFIGENQTSNPSDKIKGSHNYQIKHTPSATLIRENQTWLTKMTDKKEKEVASADLQQFHK